MAETRKLAAVMFTDLVGYTALMSKDEQKALALLQRNREMQKSLAEMHHGEFLKEMGDGTLLCFQSALDAVRCAMEIQNSVKDDSDLNLRIGIHLGDIVFKEGDVFGDGVNVASRIEKLAEAGGICISEQIYLLIRNQPNLNTVFVGEKKLKNVNHPIKIYAIAGEGLPEPSVKPFQAEHMPVQRSGSEAQQSEPISGAGRTTGTGRNLRFLIFVIAVAAILAGLYFILDPFKTPLPPCLRPDAELIQLTSEPGDEFGSISPDGRFIQYVNCEGSLFLKDIETGNIQLLEHPDLSSMNEATWSPDGKEIAVVTFGSADSNQNCLLIYNTILGKFTDRIICYKVPLFLRWSPDGRAIAYVTLSLQDTSFIEVFMLETRKKICFKAGFGKARFPAWSPDSRSIAFIENRDKYGVIRVLDLVGGKVTAPMKGAKTIEAFWNAGGFTWSPKGDYLVYTSIDNQLTALPFDIRRNAVKGSPFSVVDLKKSERPHWPHFTSDGLKMSFSISDDDVDIYLLSLDCKNQSLGSTVKRITWNKKIDFDPSWSHEGSYIIFLSFRDNQADLYRYNFESDETERITRTRELERLPQIIPGSSDISYMTDGSIKKIIQSSGRTVQVTPDSLHLTDTYAWSGNGRFVYTVRTNKSKGWYHLIRYNPDIKETAVLLKDLSSTSELLISPDGNKLAVTDIGYNEKKNTAAVVVYDLNTGNNKNVYSRSAGAPRGIGSWTKDSKFLFFDDFTEDCTEHYHLLVPVESGEPRKVTLKAEGLPGFPCVGQVSPSGDYVLCEIFLYESDMWMLKGK